METWKKNDLNGNLGFHGSASTPEDEGEEREQEKETENESEEVAATRECVVSIFTMEKPFFLNDIDLLPWLKEAIIMVVVVVLVGECGGGRRVRRGSNRGGVEGSSDGFLTVVRVP